MFTPADGSSYGLNDAVAGARAPGAPGSRSGLVAPAGVHGTMKLPLTKRDSEAGPSDAVVRGVGPERHNKLSGTVEEASGEMTILEATCDPGPRLSVAVDATLASEPGRPKVQVESGLASLIRG